MTTNYYCTSYTLKNAINNLNNYNKKRIQTDTNNIALDNHKDKILMYIDKIRRYIKDIEIFYGGVEEDKFVYSQLEQIEKEINDITNNNELSQKMQLINMLLDRIKYMTTYYYWKSNNIMTYQSEEHNNSVTNVEIQTNKINAISSNIKYDRNTTYYNPCIFTINESDYIKDCIPNLTMYGTTEESYKNTYDYSVYDKIITEKDESLNNETIKKNMFIANKAFDILDIQPKVSLYHVFKDDLYTLPLREHVALRDNIKYLRLGGILFYTIPYTRLTYEIMLLLAKNFININVIKTSTDDLFNNITIIAQRQSVKEYEESYARLKSIKYEDITNSIDYVYTLPANYIEITLFKGGILSENDLNKYINSTDLYNDFFKEITREETSTDVQPLLPFNIGQIGLILTSGRLDGVVEEPGDRFHVIKGRTVKYVEHIDQNKTKTSNKVQINAIGADGTYIEIN